MIVNFSAAGGRLAIYDSEIDGSGANGVEVAAISTGVFVHKTGFDGNTRGVLTTSGQVTIEDSTLTGTEPHLKR